MDVSEIGAEITAVGTALGVLKSSGPGGVKLQSDFFSSPADHVGKMVSNPAQRAALLDALDGLLPPDTPASLNGTGRTFHPLLDRSVSANGQLYLAIGRATNDSNSPIDIALSAEVHSDGPGPAVTAELPLLTAQGSTVTATAGTPDGPLTIELRVPIDGTGGTIVLGARVVAPPHLDKTRLMVRLETMGADGKPQPALELDPLSESAAIGQLVASLLEAVFATLDPNAPQPLQDLARNLPGLLGLSDGLPAFPFSNLGNPGSVRGWLATLASSELADGSSALTAWLNHIAGLVGAPQVTSMDPPTEEDPYVIALLAPAGALPGVDLLVGVRSDASSGGQALVATLRVSVEATAAVSAAVEGEAVLLVLPLAGTAAPTLLERLDLGVRAPKGQGQLCSGTGISVGSLKGGLRYDGTQVTPLLELIDVDLGAAGSFPTVDLTDVHTLGSAAQAALEQVIRNGLGSTAADIVDALFVLLGIDQTPSLDLARFASAPTLALADYYRGLRQRPNGWKGVLEAVWRVLGGPAGAAPQVDGSGTRDDPWRTELAHFEAPAGAKPSLLVTLWDDAAAGSSAPQLRLGLRAEVDSAGGSTPSWSIYASGDLVGFDLPPGGGGAVHWLGQQRLHVEAASLPTATAAGITLSATDLKADAAWIPGAGLSFGAHLDGVSVSDGTQTVTMGNLPLPPLGLDLQDPALGIGVAPADLWAAVRLLVGRAAASWAGAPGATLAAVLGLGSPSAAGLPDDFPPLALPQPGDLRSLLDEPLKALQGWLATLVSAEEGLAADGAPFLDWLRRPLQAFLTDSLPALVGIVPNVDVPPTGSGSWDDPWTIPLQPDGDQPVELLAWLEPDGPPAEWSDDVLSALDAERPDAAAVIEMVVRLAPFLDERAAAVDPLDTAPAVGALRALADTLAEGDGIVPAAAAVPDGDGWQAGAAVIASHDQLPRAPDAVAQVLAQLDVLTGALQPDEWNVVLLSAELAGDDCWNPLLEQAGVLGTEEIVDLRPGSGAAAVDLGGVGAAPWYVVRLADDGTAKLGDVTAQLDRVLAQIAQVRPGSKPVLIAHSYPGVAAQAWAGANASSCLGIVSLGCPLVPIDPDAVLANAEGVRLVRRLAPEGLGSAPALDAALRLLETALDGHVADGALPRAADFPAAAFARAPETPVDLQGLPAFAIAGALEADLVLAVAETVAAAASVESAAVSHLAYGARVALGLPAAAADDPSVEATLRLDLGRVPLVVGAPDPPQPAQQLVVEATLGGGGQWLLGGAGDGSVQQARVRSAEIAFVLAPGGTSGRVGGVAVRLHDVSVSGVSAPYVDLGDPMAPTVLAEVVRELDSSAASNGRLKAVLDVLAALGLLQRGGPGGTTVAADALASLLDDPLAYLGPLVPPLLDSTDGLAGLKRDAGTAIGLGPWRLKPSSLPVELVVEPSPWRVSVRTTGDGLHTSLDGRVTGDWQLRLTDIAPTVETHFTLAGLELHRDAQTGEVTLASSWLDEPIALVPSDPAKLGPALASLIPRVIADAALTALVEELSGGTVNVGSLSELVFRPGAWLSRALGDGTLPDPQRINDLLAAFAGAAGLDTSPSAPLALPGGIVLRASGAGPALRLELSTPTPLDFGGLTIGLAAHLDVDAARHVTPGGSASLQVPLPAAAGWDAVGIDLGADPSGLSFSVDVNTGASTVTVGLLPSVSGLADLATAGAELLLAEALDELVDELSSPAPSQALSTALDIATALKLYDPAQKPNGFRNSTSQANLAKLVDDVVQGNISALAADAASAAQALLSYLLGPAAVPSGLASTELGVRITGVLGGQLELRADLGVSPPAVSLSADNLDLDGVVLHVSAGYSHPNVTASVRVDTSFDTGRGVTITPRLDVGLSTAQLQVALRPLGNDDVVVTLSPSFTAPTLADLEKLAENWVVPLAANLLLGAIEPWLGTELWTGANKTVRDMLVDSGLADSNLHVKITPLPSPVELLVDALKSLKGLQIPLPGGVALDIDEDTAAQLLGLRVAGEVAIPAGDYEVTVKLGVPDSVGAPWGDAGKGVAVFMLDTSATPPRPAGVLRLGGLGVKVAGAEDAALLDTSGFRLGAVAAYVLADIDVIGPQALKRPTALDAAIELDGIGLPLSPGGDGPNPVASSLLSSGGSGDPAPANPPFDLTVAGGSKGWAIGFGGKSEIRIDVNRTFGPLHIADVILGYLAADGTKPTGPTTQPGKVLVGVDGGVSISPLNVDVQGLTLAVPLRHPAELSQWSVDLEGLAASFSTSSVEVAGGLLKQTTAAGIEYDGALSVQVAGRGLTALGSYAQLKDASGQYTSLFIFVTVSIPIGGPPYLFITGLAGGAGYNRRLLVPSDPAAVSAFPLVAAMNGFDGASPMDALGSISKDIPPSRGSYWIAAGVKFSTFELLHTQALVYASLDRGLEIGLLGLMQLALPPDTDVAVVSLELALAARYSTVDQILSFRAALTRNSWLISHDCQLTGGFAFVAWFAKPEAMLTVGGYGPLYKPPPYYPSVDPVGFHWAVTSGVVVKGENYFALTPDALAFGGRLEASYDVDPIRVWFVASVDVLVQWDPFRYEADAQVQIGASFHMEICFFACVTISVSVTLSAGVQLKGPPLHGTVTVDLDIASVTVEFGSHQDQHSLSWSDFSAKYLSSSDPPATTTKTSVAAGARAMQVPSEADRQANPNLPQGTPNGTANRPWAVSPEFTLRVETKMPAVKYQVTGRTTAAPQLTLDRSSFDVVPMESSGQPLSPTLVISISAYKAAGTPSPNVFELTPATSGFPAAIWEGGAHDGSQPTMVHGLGSVQMTVQTTPKEASGRLGDAAAVPFSTLVDEEPQRPLPLQGSPGSTIQDVGGPPQPPQPVHLPKPLLRAVVPPPAAPHVRSARRTTVADDHGATPRAPRRNGRRDGVRVVRAAQGRAHRTLPPIRHPDLAPSAGAAAHRLHAEAAKAVLPGATHVWDLPRGGDPVTVRLRGDGAVRLTALSATGVPLLDLEGAAATFAGSHARLPEEARRVVVSGLGSTPARPARPGRAAVASDGAATGWQLSTPLLKVAPTTLLAHGATVLTPLEVHPPTVAARRYGGEGWLDGAAVALAVPGLTTILGTGTDVVIVQLDSRVPGGSGLGDFALTAVGGKLGEATVVESGPRTCLVFPVEGVDADELRVSVASLRDWRIAGVVGAPGTVRDWTRRLRADPHSRLVDIGPIVAESEPPAVAVKFVRSRRPQQVPA